MRGKENVEEVNAETARNAGRAEANLNVESSRALQTSGAVRDAAAQSNRNGAGCSSVPSGPDDTAMAGVEVGFEKMAPPINVETHTHGNASFPHRYYTVMGMPVEDFEAKAEQRQAQGVSHFPTLAAREVQETEQEPEGGRPQGDAVLPALPSRLTARSGPGRTIEHPSKDWPAKPLVDNERRLFAPGTSKTNLESQLDLGLTSHPLPVRSKDHADAGDLRRKSRPSQRQESGHRNSSFGLDATDNMVYFRFWLSWIFCHLAASADLTASHPGLL